MDTQCLGMNVARCGVAWCEEDIEESGILRRETHTQVGCGQLATVKMTFTECLHQWERPISLLASVLKPLTQTKCAVQQAEHTCHCSLITVQLGNHICGVLTCKTDTHTCLQYAQFIAKATHSTHNTQSLCQERLTAEATAISTTGT